jgi:predicted ATP-dependent serine protease
MRLSEKIHPRFTADLVERLQMEDIFTVAEFLAHDSQKISSSLDDVDLTTVEVDQIRLYLFARFAPQASSALDLLHGERTFRITSGVDELDTLLGGSGFASGHVYELFGASGSGKTQLALTVAATCAMSATKQGRDSPMFKNCS